MNFWSRLKGIQDNRNIQKNLESDYLHLTEYLKEFEQLNTTTDNIYDLKKNEVLIILKDGTNITKWSDLEDKKEVIYISENLSYEESLSYKYENFTNVKLIIAKDVTNSIKSLSYMFANCQKLKGIVGLETWDVSNVYSLECMFGWCESLANLTGMEKWDVSNVTDMSEMFCTCSNLTKLNGLEHWDTSNVTTMNKMFKWCDKLTDIHALNDWNVTSLENMSRMFWACKKLTDLTPLSNWDVSNVKEMVYTFIYCYSLTNLDALSTWNVSNLRNSRSMFDSCESLKNVNGIKSWKFESIETLERMFDNCKSLEDVSATQYWNISDSVNTGAIFRNCPKINVNPFERKLNMSTNKAKGLIDDVPYFMHIYGVGWCAIQLGDIYSRASYITDVPGDCLKSCIESITEDCDFEVEFNAEGYSFTVKADNTQCYFNFAGGEEHEFDNMNKYDLAILIYKDISNELYSWENFYNSSNNLEEMLNRLKQLIEDL